MNSNFPLLQMILVVDVIHFKRLMTLNNKLCESIKVKKKTHTQNKIKSMVDAFFIKNVFSTMLNDQYSSMSPFCNILFDNWQQIKMHAFHTHKKKRSNYNNRH